MASTKFKFLKHTADAKFQAYGKNLEEAFSNAALAVKEIITADKIQGKIKKKIEIESEDEKALLYDFLEKFIALTDSEGFLISKIDKIKIKQIDEGWELKAEVSGDNKIESYAIKTTIKAMTYQEMIIEENLKEVMVQVVVDI